VLPIGTTDSARLALDTILQKPRKGIPSWLVHIMEHAHIERLAGSPLGSYRKEPEKVYLACQRAIGTCLLDQFIPENPLTMGDEGFTANRERDATTGAAEIVRDGIVINSPEAVIEHLERVVFPNLRQRIAAFNEETRVREILAREADIQARLGPEILKGGYGFVMFPGLAYSTYGYVHYFQAFALYPEVMEKHFALQAELALLNNRAAAKAYSEGQLAPIYRLDHDMAGSHGLLVNVRVLDRLWLPHFHRCLEPLLKTDVRLVWHCDGNLMELVPRLLDVGIRGFQGFQYEDGMDYERICRMKDREGRDLIIIAGVSVTRTLPHGAPDDVRREMAWLVQHGPRTGLFLGASSSITPGVPWDNIRPLVEGLAYYRKYGRHGH